MKSIITLLALVSLSLAGIKDLKLSFELESAWVPSASSSEYLAPRDIKYSATKNVFCGTVKPSFEWLFVYGWFEVSTYSAAPKEGIAFIPFRTSYSNEIGLFHQFSSIRLSAGWLHNCQHQTMNATYYDLEKRFNDYGCDKVFLRFHWSN